MSRLPLNSVSLRCEEVELHATYLEAIARYPEETGERWLSKEKRYANGWSENGRVLNEDGTPKVQRKDHTEHYVIFSHSFNCHCVGTKNPHPERQGDDHIDKKRRPLQSKSKKVQCPAVLQVKQYTHDSEWVVFRFYHQHNHPLGVLRHLPKPARLTKLIQEKLDEVDDVARVVQIVNDKVQGVRGRGGYVTYEDVYNVYYTVNVGRTRKAFNDFESIGLWLLEHEQNKSYYTFVYGQGTLLPDGTCSSTFACGFMSPWQEHHLLNAGGFCLDATHDVTIYPNTIMYTIVICHTGTGRGLPVAYLITNDQSSEPLYQWLMGLKQRGVTPQQVTIDCSATEKKAIKDTWNTTAIPLCAWHVMHSWHSNICKKVVVDDE